MKTHESGMSLAAYCEMLFKPAAILTRPGLDRVGGPIVGVGASSRTFPLASARKTAVAGMSDPYSRPVDPDSVLAGNEKV